MYEKDEIDLLPQGEKSSVESVPQDQSSAQTIKHKKPLSCLLPNTTQKEWRAASRNEQRGLNLEP